MKFANNKALLSSIPHLAIMWYSIVAVLIAAALIAIVVFYIESQERDHIDRVTESTANRIKTLLEEDILKQITSLSEFAKWSKISSHMSENNWNLISQSLTDTQHRYEAIGWVDRSLNVRKVFPMNSNKVSVQYRPSSPST